jgi:hypothetical protein
MPAEKNSTLIDKFNEIQKFVPTLDTIQLLSVDPENVQELKWYWGSRSPSIFQRAVSNYTGYDKYTKKAKMTLAETEWKKSWFWFNSWSREDNIPGDEPLNSPIFDDPFYGEVKLIENNISLDTKLYAWGNCLASEYGSAGCTFWLTQPHRLKDVNVTVISAVFAVFRGQIDQEEDKIKVARHLQDLMVDHVLAVYKSQIHDHWTSLTSNIRKYLQGKAILPESFYKRLERIRPVLISRLPFLVEGEQGTGKLTAAIYISELWNIAVNPVSDNEGNSLKIIKGAELQGDIYHVTKILKSKGICGGETDEIYFNGTIIIDDIQLSSMDFQYLLYRSIDNSLMNRPDNPGTWFIITVASTLRKEISKGRVISELEKATGPCQITLPSLHERLAEIKDQNNKLIEFGKIVNYFAGHLGKVASGLSVDTKSLITTEWMNKPWPRNYTDLRLAILEQAIQKLDEPPY